MSISRTDHNGAVPEGYDVTSSGVRIREAQATPNGDNYCVITNASDTPIYLALRTSEDGVTCPAEVGKGIFLAPYGGGYELASINLAICEIWAIHASAGQLKRVCVQRGA